MMAKLHPAFVTDHAPIPAVIFSINAGLKGKVNAGNVLDNFGNLWFTLE